MLGLQNCAIPIRSYSRLFFDGLTRRQFAASRKRAKHGKLGAKSKFAVPTDIWEWGWGIKSILSTETKAGSFRSGRRIWTGVPGFRHGM